MKEVGIVSLLGIERFISHILFKLTRRDEQGIKFNPRFMFTREGQQNALSCYSVLKYFKIATNLT